MTRAGVFAAVIGSTLALAAGFNVAHAATVQVVSEAPNYNIVFDGAAGEANTVTLGLVVRGDPNTYSVTDATAPTTAGPGCSGGGPAGSAVTCQMPRSMSPCYIRGCPPVAPVNPGLQINLGDGDDSLDSTAIDALGGMGTVFLRADGGPGADSFADGPLGNIFTTGGGVDTVSAGDGTDLVYAAGPAPDDDDLIDLGPGRDYIDYATATYPVSISLDDAANDGGAGEADHVLNAEVARGGSAADTLVGSDTLLVDELIGGAGDDTIVGGDGVDSVDGGPGNDSIDGLAGDDSLFGDSILAPGDGDDRISGGAGNDQVVGAGGGDRLSGGRGRDQLTGATTLTRDHVRDRIDCGPGRDPTALVGTEDRIRRCEKTKLSGLNARRGPL